MPEALILARGQKDASQLEELAVSRGFRVKVCFEPEVALEWARLHKFAVALIHASVSIRDQQEIASILWDSDVLVPFVTYELDPQATNQRGRTEARLFGAVVARGENAIAVINKHLEVAKPEIDVESEQFSILVVEDLDSPRDIICMYIENMGYPLVKGVASAKEAIAELEANPFDYSCIVTDIRMPEMDGRQLIEYLRGHDLLKELPIIVLTAYGTLDCLIDCLKAGASGFLVKPPKRPDLERELSRAMRVVSRGDSPRLVGEDDYELLREILVERGYA